MAYRLFVIFTTSDPFRPKFAHLWARTLCTAYGRRKARRKAAIRRGRSCYNITYFSPTFPTQTAVYELNTQTAVCVGSVLTEMHSGSVAVQQCSSDNEDCSSTGIRESYRSVAVRSASYDGPPPFHTRTRPSPDLPHRIPPCFCLRLRRVSSPLSGWPRCTSSPSGPVGGQGGNRRKGRPHDSRI